jgi:small subunit ribosomal protein S16
LAVRIRLTRVGATKRPAYRVVAIDSRRPRDGRALEILGYYDPLTDPATVKLDADAIRGWLQKGARPSDTVSKLMRQAGMPEGGQAAGTANKEEKPKRRSSRAKPSSDAEAAAEEPAAEKAEA